MYLSHSFIFRGETFRESYLKVPEVMSYLKCPVLMLTATATQEMVDEIIDRMNLEPKLVQTVSVSCNRYIYCTVFPIGDKFTA